MRSYSIILLFLLSLFAFSCSDMADLGTGVQPTSDQIKIGTNSYKLASQTFFVDSIFSSPDSFLLGNYYDTKFGSTNAEILAQVNCPVGFTFPPNSQPDSAAVDLIYTTWVGNQYATMDVNIYEMNTGTFNYSSRYPSNLDPSVYCDQSLKLSERIFSAKDAAAFRSDTTLIRFKLNNDFVTRFRDYIKASVFSSTSNFLKYFKGMYIKANYGAASLLNVSQINLRYFYHYTYTTKNVHGGDSIVTVNNNLYFPANSEVRQVNRFKHPDRSTIVHPADSVNYIASPANLYTRISIPLNKVRQDMDSIIANKSMKATINSAMMKVEATNITTDTVNAPTTKYLLLIKESALQRFFKNKELPSDTCAILASHTVSLVVNSTTVYQDYYSYSIANLIANELQNAKLLGKTPAENLNLVLVPVLVTYNSSSVITKVSQDYLMSAVSIRSGKNSYSPLRLNMVFSGF